jgi:hypothetical protein
VSTSTLRSSFAALAMLASLVTGIHRAVGREFFLSPIVGGHRLQPQQNELQALGAPDVTAPEAAEIDRLYQKLLQGPGYQRSIRRYSSTTH